MERLQPTTARTRRLLTVLGWVAIFVAMWGAADARADKFDKTLDLSLHIRGGTFGAAGMGLRSRRGTGPSAVTDAHPRLVGQGRSVTSLMRVNLSLNGFRFGIGAGYRNLAGLRLDRDRLPSGYYIDHGRVGGLPFEGFVGYALGDVEPVRPYVELRTTATVVVAQARLMQQDVGDLGKFWLHATAFDVVGRAGVLVPLGEFFFLDAGMGWTFHGSGGWVGSVGIGIPIPTANL